MPSAIGGRMGATATAAHTLRVLERIREGPSGQRAWDSGARLLEKVLESLGVQAPEGTRETGGCTPFIIALGASRPGEGARLIMLICWS